MKQKDSCIDKKITRNKGAMQNPRKDCSLLFSDKTSVLKRMYSCLEDYYSLPTHKALFQQRH